MPAHQHFSFLQSHMNSARTLNFIALFDNDFRIAADHIPRLQTCSKWPCCSRLVLVVVCSIENLLNARLALVIADTAGIHDGRSS